MENRCGRIQLEKRKDEVKMKTATIFRSSSIPLAIFGLLMAGSTAKAGCGDPAQSGSGVATLVPLLEQSDTASALENGSNSQADGADRDHKRSIVGLWHVRYVTSGGTLFYEALDQWHSDFTEFENANLPPAIGNICFGVWKETGPRTVKLHHVGWLFNTDGSSAGTFALDQVDTLANNGATYTGSFVYRRYDVIGNLLQEVKGTQAARRITVDCSKNE